MNIESSVASYRTGVLPMLVLSLLKREDMYGYQLVQTITEESGGIIAPLEGTLYPILYRMEAEGIISTRRVKVGVRRTRVYYHLEPTAEASLNSYKREFEEINRIVARIVEGKEKTENA